MTFLLKKFFHFTTSGRLEVVLCVMFVGSLLQLFTQIPLNSAKGYVKLVCCMSYVASPKSPSDTAEGKVIPKLSLGLIQGAILAI